MIYASLFIATLTAVTPKAPELNVPLNVRAETPLADETVEMLVREVEDIFAPLGVRLDVGLPSKAGVGVAATVVIRAHPARPRVTGCTRGRHDHRLALAVLRSRRIVLWTDQTARAARGQWDSARPPRLGSHDMGRALGRVLAHELGHLALGLPGHDSSGLMRASFRQGDLMGKRREGLGIAEEDVERLRSRLALYLGAIDESFPVARR